MGTNADCGVTFEHDPHPFKTERGKIKACDGSITKEHHGPITWQGRVVCLCGDFNCASLDESRG